MTKFFDAVQRFTEKRLTYKKALRATKNAKKRTFVSELLDWLNALVFGVVVVFLLHQFLLEIFLIPSPSMEDTLKVGDRVYVSKITYGIELYPYGPKILNSRTPDRDDVITFYNPTYENKGSIASIFTRLLYMATLGLVNIEVNEDGSIAEWLLVKRTAGKTGDTITFVNGDAKIRPSGMSSYLDEAEFRRENDLSSSPHRSISPDAYPGYIAYARLMALIDDLKVSNSYLSPYLIDTYSKWINTDQSKMYDEYTFYKEYNASKRAADPSDMSARSTWSKYNIGVYVPEGHILPLGDNRDNSNDGRYFGPVKISNINGHLTKILWPLSRSGKDPS